ncbi:MAG: LCP family protein [Dehalococcoidia bacterium]|nr:LCP family protein [Dehalococcoidia bacterium]
MKQHLPRVWRVSLVLLLCLYVLGGAHWLGQGSDAMRGAVAAWMEYTAESHLATLASWHSADASHEDVDPLSEFPTWGGRDRITGLLMGVDQRIDEVGWEPGRTDFMMVVTIDPTTRTAGMLSIPRDLFVTIPVSSTKSTFGRINEAYRQGIFDHAPDGGIGVARRTVEQALGIRTNFGVVVNFQTVIDAVDRIGGLTIDVPRPLKDNEYPTDDYGRKRLYVLPGLQRMDGRAVLEYARSRHQDSDFERNRRQQQVLFAGRDRALHLDVLPYLPALIMELRDDIRTDLTPAQMLGLARLAATVSPEDVIVRSIDSAAVERWPWDFYLVPNRTALARIVADVFSDPRVQREQARVTVVSDPARRAVADQLARALQSRGVNATVEPRPSRTEATRQTVVLDYTGKPATTRYIAELLRTDQVLPLADIESDTHADIEIVIGNDLRLPAEPRPTVVRPDRRVLVVGE